VLRRNRFVLVVALRDDLGNGAAEASVADFDRRLAQAVIAQIHQAMLAPIVHIVHVGAETSVAKVIQRSKGSNADIVHGSVAPVAKIKGAAVAPVARIGVVVVVVVVVDGAAVAAVALVRRAEGGSVAPVAGFTPVGSGPEHAAVAQILVGFFADAEVFRRKLPVGPQDGTVKSDRFVEAVHAGSRSVEGGSSSRDGGIAVLLLLVQP